MATTSSTFYSGGGIVTTDIGVNSDDLIQSVTLLSDGKILVVGDSDNGVAIDCVMVRYNSDGSLDTSFGSGGKVIVHNDYRLELQLQGDGKILLFGESRQTTSGINSDYDFTLIRYNSDGRLDTSFGSNGIVTTDIGLHSDDYISSLTLSSNGNILVNGRSYNGVDTNFVLVHYNSDGSRDTSFDTDGIVTTNIGTVYNNYLYDIKLPHDNKILVATQESTLSDTTLRCYNSDGSLDASFGSSGKVIVNFDFFGHQLRLQSDGKILLCGESHTGSDINGDYDLTLMRYNRDGSLDTSFGSGGTVTTDIGLHSDEYITDLTLLSDGKVLVAGDCDNGVDSDIALVRYNSDGSLDASFGIGGKVITDINFLSQDQTDSMTLQSDGKILVVANERYVGNDLNYRLVRYNSDGSLDTSFGNGGIVTTDIGFDSNDYIDSLTLQSDGKILISRESYNSVNSDFTLVRYNSDGTLDTAPPMLSMIRNSISVMPEYYTDTATAAGGAPLHFQFIGDSTGEVLIGTAYNDFINVAGGNDAVDAGAGNDVIDGGTGSNFLTGGAGIDIFFSDGRSGATTWSTITDWQADEQLTVWGWTPGTSRILAWVQDGAEGYKGLTMHADLNGDGTVDTSVTFTGITSQSQLPTPLEFDGLLWFT
jgi:uncharacterized delta-60 repeat protein